MASSFPSLDFAGSPENPGSSVIHLCMSVKRTAYGSRLGYLSVRAIAMSSVSSQSNVGGIAAPRETTLPQSHRGKTQLAENLSPLWFSAPLWLSFSDPVPWRNFYSIPEFRPRYQLSRPEQSGIPAVTWA